MGKFLFIGAIMVLVAGIANFFLQSSALADAVGAGDRHLLGLHGWYDLEAGARRLRDQPHQRHAERLPWTSTTYSRVCCRCSASPAVTTETASAASENRARGPAFFGCARTPRSTPRAPCAGTCSLRPGRHAAVAGLVRPAAWRRAPAWPICSSRETMPAAPASWARGSDRRAVRPAPWRERPSRGGSTSQLVGRTVGHQIDFGQLEQVARRERGLGFEVVALRVLARALHQRHAALDTQHLAPCARSAG